VPSRQEKNKVYILGVSLAIISVHTTWMCVENWPFAPYVMYSGLSHLGQIMPERRYRLYFVKKDGSENSVRELSGFYWTDHRLHHAMNLLKKKNELSRCGELLSQIHVYFDNHQAMKFKQFGNELNRRKTYKLLSGFRVYLENIASKQIESGPKKEFICENLRS
jgi:hypothetical protein